MPGISCTASSQTPNARRLTRLVAKAPCSPAGCASAGGHAGRRRPAAPVSSAQARQVSVRVARDDRAGQAGASIAGRLRAVVIGHRMHDQALADDVGGATAHADAAERELHVDAALRVGLQRRQVTGMAFGGVLRAMRLAGGVEVRRCSCRRHCCSRPSRGRESHAPVLASGPRPSHPPSPVHHAGG